MVSMSVFVLSVCTVGICFGGMNVKCAQKTGVGYTTCVTDSASLCDSITSGAVFGDKANGGSCTCATFGRGCNCGTNVSGHHNQSGFSRRGLDS